MHNIEKHVEERAVLFTSLMIGIVTLVATILNFILQLGIAISLWVLFISLVYFSFFFYIKKKKLTLPLKYFITIFSLVILNITWYYNFFSTGPALGNFILYYAFMLFIWDKRNSFFISVTIIINLTGLMLYEYNNYQNFETYLTNEARIIDIYFGLLIVLIVIHFYTVYLKTNYLKQYEKAKKSDNLKSSFLANLSHEIRTPLNSIIGFSDLMTTEDLSLDDKQLYNTIIQNNSNDLLTLIEDIVDLSMIESDQVKLVKSEFNLNILLEELYVEYSKTDLNNKPIEIIYKHPSEGVNLYTDPLRVRQIIKNFLNNAIKYTNRGTITLGYIFTHDEVEIYVSDTGIGIKEEFVDLIFDRFMKIEGKAELFRGVGLGLHLSKRIAQILKGEIWVNTEFGKGSTFYLKIPISTKIK